MHFFPPQCCHCLTFVKVNLYSLTFFFSPLRDCLVLFFVTGMEDNDEEESCSIYPV